VDVAVFIVEEDSTFFFIIDRGGVNPTPEEYIIITASTAL